MEELVVCSRSGSEFEFRETEIVQKAEKPNETKTITPYGDGAAAAAGGVRWERFLPKMTVRVLLVEADDSTRQIIAALLRKCSYRVAAVPDGLKAWEVLKGSPCNIDLILTEVELPLISGYALLTLIMEHEVYKNIPVIMMSAQDSISTVYKCMLRGAADFLVKPVRKNELRNLWQHVWRKQASSTGSGFGLPDESVQQKDETTGENNDISNHSSDMSSIQKNRECIEKGSDDAQSSCTKPGIEGEYIKHGHCISQPKNTRCLSDDINISTEEECHQECRNKRAHDNESRGTETHAMANVDAVVLENNSAEAIDLIGGFNNHLKGNSGSSNSNVSANKFDILPLLDLSLRRPHPSGSANQVNDERLNHSDASAFSRYTNNPTMLHKPMSPVTFNHQKYHETNSKNQSSNYTPDNHVSMTTTPTRQQEITFPYSHNRNQISHPIPVRGSMFENPINAYNFVMPPLYRAQSGSSSLSGPHTPHHTESFPQLSTFYPSDNQPSDRKICNSIGQAENKAENLEDKGFISSENDQSGNSTSGNSNKCNDKIYAVIKAPLECGNEESLHVREGAYQRSMLREAALNKFRLKRKDRCFDKKVRYESRKKLAEQRPRVKGQFVRQVPNHHSQPGNS